MRWYRRLFGRARTERQLDAELRFHLDRQIEDYIATGMAPEEARRRARLEFGGLDQVKEECRDVGVARFFESLIQDVRYGLRQLRRNPGFTAVAVTTLALGIGATTAIFSVVNGVLLTPLPYGHADRLVVLWETIARSRYLQTDSYPNFRDWQHDARSFESMAAWHAQGDDLTSPGSPKHVAANEITSRFFATLDVKLVLGREFTPQEDRRGGTPVVIISNRLWRKRFNASPHALGRVITLDGVDYSVVGVAPRAFSSFGHSDVYTPLGQSNRANPDLYSRADHAGIVVIGSLKAGVKLAQAQAEMRTIQSHLYKVYPDADRGLGLRVVTLKQQTVGHVAGTLLVLFGAVGLVLLIACANVANLLLARSAARRREFAIRSALGASRLRTVRQLVTESVLLSLVGGGAGLAIATWGLKPVLAAVPQTLPRSNNIHLNFSVLAFAFGIAVAAGIVFALAPALRSSEPNLQGGLKEGGRSSPGGATRTQNTLVISEVALTLILLAGAGLLLRTMRRLWEANLGFEPEHLITFKVGLSPSLGKTAPGTRTTYGQLLDRIRSVPGVKAATLTYLVPLEYLDVEANFWFGPHKPAFIQEAPRMLVFLTGPDYLRVMQIPLLRGRFFTAEDNRKSPLVIVIDSVFAHTYFHGRNPVGQSITFDPINQPCRIIGVVGHVRHWGLGRPSTYTRAQSYFPLYQIPDRWVPSIYTSATVIVHTALSSATAMPAIRKAVYGAGQSLPVYDVQTMRRIVSDSIGPERFPTILLGSFAGLALLLALVGIYGVISYSVTQRVHDIGVRMALGAQRKDVFQMVIGQGLRLVLLGLAIGIPAALILTRIVSSFSNLIYGVGPADPVTFVAVSLLFTGIALLACYIPADRAAKIDPMVALRHE
jgi:predicted permease